jgi:hypothetical protein
MNKIFTPEYSVCEAKATVCNRVFCLLGTVFTIDAHAIGYSLSTPFFPRR